MYVTTHNSSYKIISMILANRTFKNDSKHCFYYFYTKKIKVIIYGSMPLLKQLLVKHLYNSVI